jgi:putative ABC transport system ATP-binding protein
VLELRDVVKSYKLGGSVIQAVAGVSLEIAKGELVALYGPSGSGKTTLIELIAGLRAPDGGSVLVGGRDVTRMSRKDARDYRLRELGIVMAPSSLQPGSKAITTASLKLTSLVGRRLAVAQIAPLLARLGLSDRVDHRIAQLSMGERQRVLIALALSCDPALVLADEPTASLDSENTHSVLELLRRLCRERDMALLVATHDPEVAGYADRVHELRDGRIGERRAAAARVLGGSETI